MRKGTGCLPRALLALGADNPLLCGCPVHCRCTAASPASPARGQEQHPHHHHNQECLQTLTNVRWGTVTPAEGHRATSPKLSPCQRGPCWSHHGGDSDSLEDTDSPCLSGWLSQTKSLGLVRAGTSSRAHTRQAASGTAAGRPGARGHMPARSWAEFFLSSWSSVYSLADYSVTPTL